MTGPPTDDVGPGATNARADREASADTTTIADDTAPGGRQPYDVLAGLRRRRAAAVRLDGGDPEHPGGRRRYDRPTTGIGAPHLRDGHARGVQHACRELWAHLDDAGRARAVELVAAADGEADR